MIDMRREWMTASFAFCGGRVSGAARGGEGKDLKELGHKRLGYLLQRGAGDLLIPLSAILRPAPMRNAAKRRAL